MLHSSPGSNPTPGSILPHGGGDHTIYGKLWAKWPIPPEQCSNKVCEGGGDKGNFKALLCFPLASPGPWHKLEQPQGILSCWKAFVCLGWFCSSLGASLCWANSPTAISTSIMAPFHHWTDTRGLGLCTWQQSGAPLSLR